MNILRSVMRPLLAAPFFANGVDAMVHADRHVEQARQALPFTEDYDDAVLTWGTRALGGAVSAAAVTFAMGRAPRTSAAFLAVTAVPMAIIHHPVWQARGMQQRREMLAGLSARAAVMAGMGFAAVDRVGQPSLSWRTRYARDKRRAVREAREVMRARVTATPERS